MNVPSLDRTPTRTTRTQLQNFTSLERYSLNVEDPAYGVFRKRGASFQFLIDMLV